MNNPSSSNGGVAEVEFVGVPQSYACNNVVVNYKVNFDKFTPWDIIAIVKVVRGKYQYSYASTHTTSAYVISTGVKQDIYQLRFGHPFTEDLASNSEMYAFVYKSHTLKKHLQFSTPFTISARKDANVPFVTVIKPTYSRSEDSTAAAAAAAARSSAFQQLNAAMSRARISGQSSRAVAEEESSSWNGRGAELDDGSSDEDSEVDEETIISKAKPYFERNLDTDRSTIKLMERESSSVCDGWTIVDVPPQDTGSNSRKPLPPAEVEVFPDVLSYPEVYPHYEDLLLDIDVSQIDQSETDVVSIYKIVGNKLTELITNSKVVPMLSKSGPASGVNEVEVCFDKEGLPDAVVGYDKYVFVYISYQKRTHFAISQEFMIQGRTESELDGIRDRLRVLRQEAVMSSRNRSTGFNAGAIRIQLQRQELLKREAELEKKMNDRVQQKPVRKLRSTQAVQAYRRNGSESDLLQESPAQPAPATRRRLNFGQDPSDEERANIWSGERRMRSLSELTRQKRDRRFPDLQRNLRNLSGTGTFRPGNF